MNISELMVCSMLLTLMYTICFSVIKNIYDIFVYLFFMGTLCYKINILKIGFSPNAMQIKRKSIVRATKQKQMG